MANYRPVDLDRCFNMIYLSLLLIDGATIVLLITWKEGLMAYVNLTAQWLSVH